MSLSGNGYEMPPFVQFVDTLGWRSGVLLVRVYAKEFNGGALSVVVQNTMVSADDPSVTFTEADPLTDITSIRPANRTSRVASA